MQWSDWMKNQGASPRGTHVTATPSPWQREHGDRSEQRVWVGWGLNTERDVVSARDGEGQVQPCCSTSYPSPLQRWLWVEPWTGQSSHRPSRRKNRRHPLPASYRLSGTQKPNGNAGTPSLVTALSTEIVLHIFDLVINKTSPQTLKANLSFGLFLFTGTWKFAISSIEIRTGNRGL